MSAAGRWVVLLLAAVAVLTACGRAYVVQRDRGPPRVVQAIPASGEYRVVRGDTLYGIAFRHGLDYREVAGWNRIGPPYTIYPGQIIRLRPGAATAATPPRASRPAPAPATRPPPGQPAPVTRPPPSTPPSTPAPSVPAAGPIAWRWPTEGAILGRFVAGDPTRQGLDIAGKDGQPVRAAADGVVVYSGAGLVGYGELVIVKHSDEWLSAYGHNRRRLVAEGERVKAGQQIAEMGRTGASRDMLHFEIRRNGKPVDPLPLLPPR